MAPPAPRECNQPARSVLHRKQSAHRPALRIPCIAAHCIATSSQHIGPRIASCAAQRTARMQPARAKARGFIKTLFLAHCIANNPRTDNQPATHRPPRPPHGAHLAPAALHALRSTLRWFRFVRGTNFSKIQFIYIANCIFVMCS
jgi:hypothetical protein